MQALRHSRTFVIFHFVLLLVSCVCGSAQSGGKPLCTAPTTEELTKTRSYLAERYHLPPTEEFHLISSAAANSSCFWRLEFHSGNRQQSLIVYLSPDRKYLSPDLYDLSISSDEEQSRRRAELSKTLSSGNPPTLGSAHGFVTIVAFEDFECPFCKQLDATLERGFLPESGGDVKLVFRQFPLKMHPWARDAAIMSTCVAIQSNEGFWSLHNFLFDSQSSLTQSNLFTMVASFLKEKTSINGEDWQSCLKNPISQQAVDRDIELGTSNGVRATPTIFVNGKMIRGILEIEQLRVLIELARQGK